MYSVKELAPCPKGLVLFLYPAPVAQLVEQRSFKPWVLGPSPSGGTAKGGGMDMLIAIIGSCVVFAACLIALWLMP